MKIDVIIWGKSKIKENGNSWIDSKMSIDEDDIKSLILEWYKTNYNCSDDVDYDVDIDEVKI